MPDTLHVEYRARAALFMFLALFLTACGTGSPTADGQPSSNASQQVQNYSRSTPIDPCKLVGQSVIEQLLGSPVSVPSIDVQDEKQAICSYYLLSNPGSAEVYINLHFLSGEDDRGNFVYQLDYTRNLGGDSVIVGMNDAAYSETLGLLYAIKGNIGINVIVNHVSEPKRKSIAISIASRVLEALS